MVLNDARKTPAHTKYDGSNYYPTQKWVLFGHHFAAIAGAGPRIGPVLATQFGWAPGFIWLLAVLPARLVFRPITLWASTRWRPVARRHRPIGNRTGCCITAIIAVLFILVVALAGWASSS
jgi:carbon starvation protein